MSGRALGWAKRTHAPCRDSKAALVFLADYAFDGLFAFPSVGTLAGELQVSTRTVQRMLKVLVEASAIIRCDVEDRATKRTRTCAYYFPVDGRGPTVAEIKAFELKVGGRVTAVSPWEGDAAVAPSGVTDAGQGEGDTAVTPMNQLTEQSEPKGSSQGASEVASLFDEILEAAPPAILKFHDADQAFAAVEALQRDGVAVAALPECLRRMARDPAFRSRKHPPQLHVWLAKRQFLGWLRELEASGPADAQASASAEVGVTFEGPAELRAQLVAAKGEAFAAAYLDRAEFDPAASRLTPATGTAAQRLGEVRGLLRKFGVELAVEAAGQGVRA